MGIIQKIQNLFQAKNKGSQLDIDEIKDIAYAYNDVLLAAHQGANGQLGFSEDLLPYSKSTIRKALYYYAAIMNTQEDTQLCGGIYAQLAYFIPPDDALTVKRYYEVRTILSEPAAGVKQNDVLYEEACEIEARFFEISQAMMNDLVAKTDEWNKIQSA